MAKNRFGTLVAMAAGAATTATLITYDRQKRDIVARLQAGSQIAQTKAGPIEVATVGEGPAVLVSHGILGGYDQGLAAGSPLVEAGFKVIAVSRFGYLRTPVAANMSPSAQADQYAALLDELDIDDVAMLGASAGGPSALQFALRHPDRCRALIMMCAASQRLAYDQDQASPGYRLFGGAARSDFLLWLAVTGAIKGLPFLSNLGPEFTQPMVTDPKRQAMFQAALHSLFPASLRQAGIDNDVAQIAALADMPLEQVVAPTLVLHGTADSLIPFSQAEHTAGMIPGARLVAVEGGDHLFPISHYDQVWPEVIASLNQRPKEKPITAKPAKKAPAKKTSTRKTPARKKTS